MSDPGSADPPRHTIRVAARRSGLTAATIRAWERRHGAVRPARSGTERRLYTDADIERLRLMRALAGAGHSVGQLARHATDELRAMAHDDAATSSTSSTPPAPRAVDAPVHAPSASMASIAACEDAIRRLDGDELHRLLLRALVEAGPARFLDDVAAPLCHRIGELWAQGALSVAHEHVASVAMRQTLGFLLATLQPTDATGPVAVAATPPGQRHEFGAMMAGAIAALAGWRVVYLGPDVPEADLALAVRQTRARALLVSIATTHGDAAVRDALRRLRGEAGRDVAILVGGRAAHAFDDTLDAVDARRPAGLDALRDELRALGGLHEVPG